MERRSNLMVILGIAFFVIGGLIVFLVLRDSDDDGGVAVPGKTTIVVANEALAAGALGDDIIEQGLVSVRTVDFVDAPVGAIASVNQLAGATLINGVDADGVIVNSNLTIDQIRAIEIPAGFDGVTVQFDFLSGGAGYVDPGDRVNVYAVDQECNAFTIVDGVETPVGCPYATPRVELLLTNVLVLDVDVQIAANRGSGEAVTPDVTTPSGAVVRRPQADQVLMLLALTPEDAEKVIHQVEFERMYISITAEGAAPAGPTSGQDFLEIFVEEPNVAFQQSNPEG